jgi:hypothetical protein
MIDNNDEQVASMVKWSSKGLMEQDMKMGGRAIDQLNLYVSKSPAFLAG